MESASVSTSRPVLHLLCGKIAAGKSTLAHQLAQQTGAVIISEDAWLAHLFAEEMQDVADYVRCAGKLRNAMTPHLIALLQRGVSVVLDFPANTVGQRQWMKAVIQSAQAEHQLHFIDVPDALCKSRLHARNAEGEHDFTATNAQFEVISSYFVAPHANEGFNVVMHG
ncbi:AAA family ATPase [Type-E symbiont of Plautia stali]|uniref:AAA family ATPase n=1 Tax=Type-E symbiont of Plautia stali TaxID=1560357 RepID=UPI00073EC39C|nr:ATP-binding protein [Type-E symbiont of Plautia stali]